MLVGVISDTHGSLPQGVHKAFEHVDRILHAGDVGSHAVLMELESIAPVCCVRGNCDGSNLPFGIRAVEAPLIGGVRFRIAHQKEALGFPQGDAQVFVCGHTHVRDLERSEGKLLINPGSATRPRDGGAPSVALVEVHDGQVVSVRFAEV